MVHLPNEDLFEDTKMTFGEHLDELRLALVKSLLGLVVGCLVGFFFAKPVVRIIEGPLKNSLEQFYLDKARAEMTARYGPLSDELSEFLRQNHLVFEEVYVERAELERLGGLLANSSPSDSSPASSPADEMGRPAAPSPDMVLSRYWKPVTAVVKALNPHEVFMIWVKAAVITGAVLASPYVFWQIWTFVAAGLFPHEKQYVHVFLPISLGLFLGGAALAFFFVFEPVLDFLFGFNRMLNIDPDPRISEWLSFVLIMPLGFGISFQLPLVMLFLERIGIFSVAVYISKWRIAVLMIFVISMFLTPADPVSMLLMAVPLTVLYFGGVAMCKWMPRRSSPFGAGYEP